MISEGTVVGTVEEVTPTDQEYLVWKVSQFKKQLHCKKGKAQKVQVPKQLKRADIKIWPRNFCDLVLLGIKELLI